MTSGEVFAVQCRAVFRKPSEVIISGRPIEPGESFGAAFIVGYFDSIEEMHAVYDEHKGHTGLEVTEEGWTLTP